MQILLHSSVRVAAVASSFLCEYPRGERPFPLPKRGGDTSPCLKDMQWAESLPEALEPVNKKMQARQVDYEIRAPQHPAWQLEGFTPNRVQCILTQAVLYNNFLERVLYGKRDTGFLQYATPWRANT